MRVIFGIILGVALTVGGAYLYEFSPRLDFRKFQHSTPHGQLGRC